MPTPVDVWISDLARRRRWRIVRPLDAGGAEIAGSTEEGLGWTCRADPLQGDRVQPVPAAEFRCRDVCADDVRWLVVEREQGSGLTVATSSPSAEGDLVVGALGALGWILSRLRGRGDSSTVGAGASGGSPVAPSIMGAGWSVADPVGILDAATAARLIGADVVPGGATLAVHLNQHGLYVKSGRWWGDAARLEHLIDCGILLSDRANALGARPAG